MATNDLPGGSDTGMGAAVDEGRRHATLDGSWWVRPLVRAQSRHQTAACVVKLEAQDCTNCRGHVCDCEVTRDG